MEMRLHLVDLYRSLSEQHSCPVIQEVEGSLQNVFAAHDGEVFIDADAVPNGKCFAVFAEALKALLSRPRDFVFDPGSRDPLMTSQTSSLVVAHFPTVLRVKVKLSSDVDNAAVLTLCSIIPSCRRASLPAGHDFPQSVPIASNVVITARHILLNVRAVLESIDATGCVFLSLAGGRALRDLARRNTGVRHVFVAGSSINPGTARQLNRATRYNRSVTESLSSPHSFQQDAFCPSDGQQHTTRLGPCAETSQWSAIPLTTTDGTTPCFDAVAEPHAAAQQANAQQPFWLSIVSSLHTFPLSSPVGAPPVGRWDLQASVY